ncbi:MAG: UDP-4-amino-4,6-dideoxy-N-acetyl-beta-L-altrosamine transaminase [Bradymonadales bacterium]|nr:MAG: UDP-4-amino-4,6-dideoxy-N-acetyl-beta-L-altrosamine transaminase [Bradymonadales bacterium]
MSSELGLFGGKPTRSKWLPYSRQWISEEDCQAVVRSLKSDWITRGPEVRAFEEEVAGFVGFPYGVAFSSATAGLHAVMACLGMKPGDEVSLPPLSFVATANAALYSGAKLNFIDVREDTLNIDEQKLADSRSPFKLSVDFAGNPVDLRNFNHGSTAHHISDAAHSLSARLSGKPAAQFSEIAVYSFHPVKTCTTGEGGCVVLRDEALAEELRRFRNHGIAGEEQPGFSPQRSLGFNYHLTEMQAALGRSQLKKLETWRKARTDLAKEYEKLLGGLDYVRLPKLTETAESSWHLFPIRLPVELWGADKAQIVAAFRAENIGVQVHYLPIYLQPYYQALGFKPGLCPMAEKAHQELLSIPLHPQMEKADLRDVVAAIEKISQWAQKRESN